MDRLSPPSPPRAYFASLSPVPLLGGVSCISTTSCVAVGVYPVHTGNTLGCCYRYRPLIEMLTNSTWMALTAPTPPRGANGSLSAVSCSGPAACVAVGNVTEATGIVPMVETWQGAQWRASTIPIPAGASIPAEFPWSVSCAATACVALGALLLSAGGSVPVAATRSAGGWSTTPLPLPPGGSFGFPFTYESQGGVSCVTPGSCVAVSPYQETGGGQGAMAESLTGGVWSATALPAPGGTSAFPQALSCVASDECVGVGSFATTAGAQAGLVETLSADGWAASALPVPGPTPGASLTALSCPPEGACVAVGNALEANGAQVPIAETQTAAGWASALLPLPAHSVDSGDAQPVVQGLSCPSATSCVAVGYEPGAALTEHPMVVVRSGSTWRSQRLPLPLGLRNQSASLSSVSCVSTTSCVAVGGLRSETDALIEVLSNGSWSATALAPPAHAPRIALSGVTCSAGPSCVAVGAYWGTDPGFSRPLVATWTGTSWHTVKLAVPPSASHNVAFTTPMLRSVSCASPSSCVAAGFYPTGFDATAPLVESLSGGRWQASTPPAPAGANWTLLWGVWCAAQGSCTAVGEADGSPLAEVLAGGNWSSTSVGLPAAAAEGVAPGRVVRPGHIVSRRRGCHRHLGDIPGCRLRRQLTAPGMTRSLRPEVVRALCPSVNPPSGRGPARCPVRGPVLVPGIALASTMGGRRGRPEQDRGRRRLRRLAPRGCRSRKPPGPHPLRWTRERAPADHP